MDHRALRTHRVIYRALDAGINFIDDALLDRIDESVAPGVTVDPTDAGWTNPALEPAARCR